MKLKVWIPEIACLGLVLASFLIILVNFNSLPERIPHHFSFTGLPDKFGQRKMIWSLPLFGGLIYVVLTVITFFIKSVSIREESGYAVILLIRSMLIQLKLALCLVILYITGATIRITRGEAEGLGGFFTPVVLIVLGVILFVNIRMILLKGRNSS
jgi:uncharacterized membrane protein